MSLPITPQQVTEDKKSDQSQTPIPVKKNLVEEEVLAHRIRMAALLSSSVACAEGA